MVLGDVERARAEHDSVRRFETLENGFHLALAAALDDRIHVLQLAGAYENRALVAQRHGARSRGAVDPDLDLEAGRDFELFHPEFLRGLPGDLNREGEQGRFLLLGVAPLLP